jgi:hypothetical protein
VDAFRPCRARTATAVALALLAGLWPAAGIPAQAATPSSTPIRAVVLRHHDLTVVLTPDTHHLRATDRLSLRVEGAGGRVVTLRLNAALQVRHVGEGVGRGTKPLAFTAEPERGSGEQGAAVQAVRVDLGRTPGRGEELVIELAFDGVVNEPPREPRHLRFVTPSETAGHIGPEGIYLSGETHWYPALPGSVATFQVRVTVPAGWEAVTHGRERSRRAEAGATTAEWEVAERTEALTLVANRFVRTQRAWQPTSGREVELAAYLFPEDAALADEYLDASAHYLEAYTKLLGPYPFPKFAVVENFFASGLGMPSFTLLGSGVIKRHYVQPYALGHEIVHSWVGNWVFNDVEAGNWVEGLTTYLANYYYEELTGAAAQARDQRRLMLFGYAVYVAPEDDYAVREFRRKTGPRDNAIGYQKCAMLFHMLRREVGEAAFWAGLRTLVADHGGTYAGWPEVERAFSRAAGRDLRWFFAQWVERRGAPALRLVEARVAPADGGPGGFAVTFALAQAPNADGLFRLRLPVRVALEDGRTEETSVELSEAERRFTVRVAGRPVGLSVDPDFELFRRLDRAQLPPMLNLFVTDRARAVVLPDEGSEAAQAPYRVLGARVAAQEGGGGAVRLVAAGDWDQAGGGSSLVLGGPGLNGAAAVMSRICGDEVRIERDRFTVGGRTYEGPSMAVLVSCRAPGSPTSVVSLFYGLSPEAAAKVARLLFFYGWQSYLVFRDGAVVGRGDFPAAGGDLEVLFPGMEG